MIAGGDVSATRIDLRQLFDEFKATYATARSTSRDQTPIITINDQQVQLFKREGEKRGEHWEAYSRMVRTDELWWITVQVGKFGDDYRAYFFGSDGEQRAVVGQEDEGLIFNGYGSRPHMTLDEMPEYDREWNQSRYWDGVYIYDPARCSSFCESEVVWIEGALTAVSGHNISLLPLKKLPSLRAHWLGRVVEDGSRDIRERVNAARQLEKMGSAAAQAVPILRKTLQNYGRNWGNLTTLGIGGSYNEHEWILAATAEALGKIGKEALPAFFDIIDKAHYATDYYLISARRALGKIGKEAGKKAENYFKTAIRAEEWRIRLLAVQALGDIGTPETVPLLEEASHDPSSPKVREEAKKILDGLRPSQALP